jgi:NTE family protein
MAGIGLALGGGGVTGCSHVGVLCALEEEGIPVDYVAGTSAGAMAALLFACGYSGADLKRMVMEMTARLLDYDYFGVITRLLVPRTSPPGLIRGKRLREYLQKAAGERSIKELRLPFAVIATDLISARQVLFANRLESPGPLGDYADVVEEASAVEAVMASMSIPGLFRPVPLGERLLVDGGLMDNCPAAALKAMGASRILAVNLVSVKPVHPARWTFSSLVSRSVSLGLHRMSLADSGYPDLVLEPDMGTIGLLDFGCIAECIEQGYECARQNMDKIRSLAQQAAED